MADLAGTDLGTHECAYDERDAILYALAVGARHTELDLVYERQLQVLPTFAVTLGLWAVWAAGGQGAYDPATTLHASQRLAIRSPLPRAARFETTARVTDVLDKGSAALVAIDVECEYFDATYTIFVPGGGGFGGQRGSGGSRALPETSAPMQSQVVTTDDQAALYRLTGDLHPVHIDPAAAQAAGFDRPILHGMCTLGAVTLQVARELHADPAGLADLDARLTSVVLPGDTLGVEIWPEGSSYAYRASSATGPAISGWGNYS